jgi:hypothetical protein
VPPRNRRWYEKIELDWGERDSTIAIAHRLDAGNVGTQLVVHVARRAGDYGVRIKGSVEVDMKAVKARAAPNSAVPAESACVVAQIASCVVPLSRT